MGPLQGQWKPPARPVVMTATFYGWKYGPVLKEIRSLFKEDKVGSLRYAGFKNKDSSSICDKVFNDYGNKNSWSLSRLTHGELSWKNSRIGLSDDENGDIPINNEDIRIDANRIKVRREYLAELGLI